MGARGRTPASSLAVVDNVSHIPEKPQAPDHLNPEEQLIWKQVVDSMEAGWFRKETHEMLAAYCRHTAEAKEIATLISGQKANADEFDVVTYDRLLKMHERETRAAISFATKLRITLQSTYDKSKKKGTQAKRTWEA